MGKVYYNSKQNTTTWFDSLITNKTLSNLILLTCFAKQWHETTSSIDDICKQALITSWIQNCPFYCENFTYQHIYAVFTPIRWAVIMNKVTRSKTKKLTFSLVAMKFCNCMLRATPAVPTQTFFRLWINTVSVGKILLLFHQKTALCCMLILFHVKMK